MALTVSAVSFLAATTVDSTAWTANFPGSEAEEATFPTGNWSLLRSVMKKAFVREMEERVTHVTRLATSILAAPPSSHSS
jgi:hypothetical protein